MIQNREQHFLQLAIELSQKGMEQGEGGPFGCVIVKGDDIIGQGWNRVLATHDPTAHAEMVAIRDACQHLQAFQLEGCEVYTSCEPCPMCLGAIYWARPSRVVYANTKEQAASISFDDSFIYQEFVLPHNQRTIPMLHRPQQAAWEVFKQWEEKADKMPY